MNYTALVETSQRSEDNMVNVTKYCQAFGKRLDNWLRLKETAVLLQTLSQQLGLKAACSNGSKIPQIPGIIESKRGKGSTGTWVHPLIAVALAQWLSPEFHIHVLEVYKRYAEGDITLADDVLQRQTNVEAIKWLNRRAEGKLKRIKFTDDLASRGVTRVGFANCTDAIYLGTFGDTANGLKQERGLTKKSDNLRDNMSSLELAAVAFAEELGVKLMDDKKAYGNKQCAKVCRQAGNRVGRALEG